MKKIEDKSRWPSIKRWLDIILLSIVALLLYFLLENEIELKPNPLPDFSSSTGLVIYILYSLLLIVFVWLLLWRMGATNFGWQSNTRIINFFSWLPIWLSILLALTCILYLESPIGQRITETIVIFLLPIVSIILIAWLGQLLPLILYISGLPVGWLLFCIDHFVINKKSKELLSNRSNKGTNKSSEDAENQNPKQLEKSTETFSDISHNPEKLILWLEEEKPINEPKEDIYQMSPLARKISIQLLQPKIETIALVGEYGSGKSSILNMVDYYLKPENCHELYENIQNEKELLIDEKIKTITCKVDGWGFAKGTAAEHILERAVNELGRHVDVCSLRFMPEQYTASMGSSGNIIFQILAAILSCCRSPLNTLQRMDRLLNAINKRLIIFLEDVDRNKSDEAFFNEIAALMDNLRKLKHVTFVLAIGQKYDTEEILHQDCRSC